MLVIGNRYDPATTYHGALVVDDLLPRSRLLTMDGAGHTTWSNSSRCIDVHVQRYLVAGTLPPVGARCAPDLQPFVDRPEAGRSLASAVEHATPGGPSLAGLGDQSEAGSVTKSMRRSTAPMSSGSRSVQLVT